MFHLNLIVFGNSAKRTSQSAFRVPQKLQWLENMKVDFQVKQEGMWLLLPLLNTKLKRNEWERLIILKPQERPESELWVPGKKKKWEKCDECDKRVLNRSLIKGNGRSLPHRVAAIETNKESQELMQWENISVLRTHPHKHITHRGVVMLILMSSLRAMKIGCLTLNDFPSTAKSCSLSTTDLSC